MMEVTVIESEALKLPEKELALLIDRLQEKLVDRKISHINAHITEANERLDAYKNGEIESSDGKSLVAKLRQQMDR